MGKAVGKALSIIGVVAGIVAAIPTFGASLGLSAALLTGISLAATLGGSFLLGKAKPPASSRASADRLFVSIDPRTPRKIVFGRTAMATDIRDQEYTGDQEYLHRFVVVASHRVQAIEEIWFDDKRVWTAAGGVEGDAVGYLSVTPILEGSAANAINISSRMGNTRRYTGCAYVHLRYKLKGNSKKSESPFAQSVPSRVTIRGKGALVYDPRLDSTVGGSGPQRADDQSTWAWNDSASRNPALQELWYELGWRINGKLAVGKGVPAARLDLQSFITSANACDEAVALAGGGTEPRYRSDGVFSEGDNPTLVRDNLKAAMNAVLDDQDGRIRLTVITNDLATPIAPFTEDDIIDGVRWDQTPPLADTFNVIRGGYTDPSDQSLYQMVDYPEISLPSIDGIERIEPFDLPMVQSPSQAQRLGKQRLQRMQYPGLFTANYQATAWRVQKGDIIRQTFGRLGWYQKLFRVVDITVRLDGVVPMILREEHASIYAWDASEAPAVTAAAPTTYDWTKNPLYADIAALEDLSSAYSFRLDNEYEGLPADYAGNVTDYAPATTSLQVLYGGADVTSLFEHVAPTAGDGRNPQGLTVAGTYPDYHVTGGFDAAEENAKFVFRVAGTGPHAGVTMDATFSLGKSKAGQDGTPPPLISISASAQAIRYNAADTIATGDVVVTTARQNTTDVPRFRLTGFDGTDGGDGDKTSAQLAAAFPSAFSTSGPDNLTIKQGWLNLALQSYGGGLRILAFALGGAIGDVVTLVKVRDGLSPPLLKLNASALVLHLNADGSLPAGTPTFVFTAARQNYTGTIAFAADPSHNLALGGGSIAGDVLTVTAARMREVLLYNRDTLGIGLTQKVIVTGDGGLTDYVTVTAALDGEDGVTPKIATLTPPSINIVANSANASKAGQFPKTAALSVKQGLTDITGAASVTLAPSDPSIVASYSAGVVSVTQANTAGYIDVQVSHASAVVDVLRLAVTRSRDPNPGASQTNDGEDINATLSSTSFAQIAAPPVVLRANASGQIVVGWGGDYTCAAAAATRTFLMGGCIAWRTAGSGTYAYTTEQLGTTATTSPGGAEVIPGSISVSQTITGLTPGAQYELAPAARRNSGNGTATITGSFQVSQ